MFFDFPFSRSHCEITLTFSRLLLQLSNLEYEGFHIIENKFPLWTIKTDQLTN